MTGFSSEYNMGEPLEVHGETLYPFTRTFRLQFPGKNGGVVWNRPSSILLRSPNGEERVLPIRDVTRQWQFLILGISLALCGLLLIMRKR